MKIWNPGGGVVVSELASKAARRVFESDFGVDLISRRAAGLRFTLALSSGEINGGLAVVPK